MRLRRVAHWAEIMANLGVIVTLVILIVQVRENTQTLRSQAILQRAAPLIEPFVWESQLPSLLARIKAVDGPEALAQAFIDRYELSYAEAATWTRHISAVWLSMAAEYELLGGSEVLEARIIALLSNPDHMLWFESGGPGRIGEPRFLAYVDDLWQAR